MADNSLQTPGATITPAPIPVPAPTVASEDIATLILQDRDQTLQRAAQTFVEGIVAEEDSIPGMQPEERPGPMGPRVLNDIGGGFLESGTQVIGGVRDAAQAAMDGLAEIVDLSRVAGRAAMGRPEPQVLDGGDPPSFGELPDVREPKTVTGGLVRGVAQFLTGFAAGSKALGTVGGATKIAKGGRLVAASAISDFAAFDGHEQRLSDLIQSFPELQNPVTEYLASDMEDSQLEGRLKNVAEGALSDVLLTGLVAGLRSMRLAKKARLGIGAETYADAQRRIALDPQTGAKVVPDLTDLRATNAPLLFGAGDVSTLGKDIEDYLGDVGARSGGKADAAQVPVEEGARALTLSRVETETGDVFINWSRMDTADDVKSVIQQMADAGKGEIDAARRGTRSNEATVLSADQENAWEVLASRRTGEAMNAEKTLALRRLWAASGEKLTEAAKLVTAAPTAANSFLFRRALALHGTIQREVLAVRTETARALQQWSIPAGSNEMIARQIKETVDMFGSEGVATDIANRILGAAKDGDLAAIDGMARRGALSATHDAVFEYWVNALLSGPKTHMVNAISNTSTVLLAQMERMVAGGIGTLRGTVDGVDATEAGAMLHGALASLPDAWRNLRRSFATGETGFGLQKLETPRTRSISTEALGNTRSKTFNRAMNQPLIAHGINALGAIATVPGRALGASDEFFKTISYRMEVNAQAARQAQDELRAGMIGPDDVKRRMVELAEDPSDAVAMAARDFAAYNTFTNDAGAFAKTVTEFRSKFPILRFIVPFVSTPANILRFTAERSPLAVAMPGVIADIRAGGRRADMAVAKMGLGSFAMLTAFDAGMNGQITGSGPSNPKARAAKMRTGWKPYSIRVGDRYFAYNRVDPIGALMGIAGNMAELSLNSQADQGAELDEAIFGAIGAVGGQMMDRTYLRGLSDFFTAMSEPERRASGYFERLSASFVPAIVREAETAIDPTLRRASNTIEKMKERIPGVSADLPPRHDLWGREISFQSGLGKVFDAVSPIYSSVDNPEPIDLEFPKINYFPGLPTTSVTLNYEKFSLKNEPHAYERYVVLQGATPASEFPVITNSRGKPTAVSARMQTYGDGTLLQTLNAIVTGEHAFSPEYDALDGPGKKRMIQRTIADYRDKARARLITEFPDLFQPGTGKR